MLGLGILGKILFERFDFRSKNECPGVADSFECVGNFVPDRFVLPFEIKESNASSPIWNPSRFFRLTIKISLHNSVDEILPIHLTGAERYRFPACGSRAKMRKPPRATTRIVKSLVK
jgi:hypothetical protein